MRKSGVLLLAIFFAATLSLVYGDAALAQTGGFVKIGGEIIPVDLQPVYDQDGNIVSYAFTAESTNLSGVRGNIKFAPPLQGALGTPSPQVGQGTCIENVIYQMVFVNGGTDPTEFTLELLPHQPINIPGQTTVRVSHSLDGELTDATGDGITMTPAGSNVIEWFVGPPQTNLGVGLGPAASHPAQANPGQYVYPYGPFSVNALGPMGPWTEYWFVIDFTLTGGNDALTLDGNLTIDFCQNPKGIPAFSHYGLILFMILLVASTLLVIIRSKRAV